MSCWFRKPGTITYGTGCWPIVATLDVRLRKLTHRKRPNSMAEPSLSKKSGGGCLGRGCLGSVLVVVAIIVGIAVITTNDSSPTTTVATDTTTTAVPTTAGVTDGTVLASWESDWSGFTMTELLVYRQGVMSVVAISPEGEETVLFEVEERPAENPGERRFDLQPWDIRSEYLVLSEDGTVRYFSWEGRQFEYARVTFMAADAMTRGLDPETMMACVPVDLSPKSLEVIRLYEQLQEFKDDPEFAQMGFAIGGPYNEWLTTIEALDDDALEVLEELGFFSGEVMMLGMEYVTDSQEGIDYFERLIQTGISVALCDETQNGDPITASATTSTTVPAPPPNPGDAVSCADFDTWEDAQAWYDTYAPHYGDIALIDTNDNGVACEKLLPEDVTVEQAAASLTTSTTSSTTATDTGTTGVDALFDLLAGLSTAVEDPAGYDRADYEHDRRYLCDTPGVDPYTGLAFEPETCDVDHIVAAKEAHESGGYAWDRPTRQAFGNDALNLVASRDCVNRSKGSSDPAEWSRVQSGTCAGTTITTAGRCFWVASTITVKHRYDLSVDTAERAALRAGLDDCPDNINIESPPRATTGTTQPTTTTTASAATASQTNDCHPAYDPCLPNQPGDALNCGDLTAAQRPVRVKEIGVDPYQLDRDQDGKACE